MNKENQVSTIRDHSKAYVFVLAASTVLDRFQIVEKPRVAKQKYYDNVYRILKHYGVPLSGLPRNVDSGVMRHVRARLIDKKHQATKSHYQFLFDVAQKRIIGILGTSPAEPPSTVFDLKMPDTDFDGAVSVLFESPKDSKAEKDVMKSAVSLFSSPEFEKFDKSVSDCQLSYTSGQSVIWKANRIKGLRPEPIAIKAYRENSVLEKDLRAMDSLISGHLFVSPEYVVQIPRADFDRLLGSQECQADDFAQHDGNVMAVVYKWFPDTVKNFIENCKYSTLRRKAFLQCGQKPDEKCIAPSVKDLLIFSIFELTLKLHAEDLQHRDLKPANIVLTVDPSSITVLNQPLYSKYYEGEDPFSLLIDGGSITSTGEVSVTPETDGYNISPNIEAMESRPRMDNHSLAVLVAEVVTEKYLHEMFPRQDEEDWEEWGVRVWNDKVNCNGKVQAKIKELWPDYNRELLKHVLKGINPHLVDDDWGKEGMEIMVNIMNGYKKNPLP